MNFIEVRFYLEHWFVVPGGLWTSPTWHQRSVRAGLSVCWRQQKSWKPGTVAFAIPTLHTQGPKRRKVFMKLTCSFPEAFLLLGTLKDVQRKRSLWMNMLELRVVVAIFSFWYVYGFSDLPQKNLTLDVPPWEFRSCKPSQLTLDWLMGSYYPIDPWNLFGKQPRSNSFLVSHLMSYSWLMCFFSVKFSPIDLFHRFRLLVFFLETPILLWTMIVEGSFLFVWSSSLCFVSLRHFNSGVPYNEHSIICKP